MTKTILLHTLFLLLLQQTLIGQSDNTASHSDSLVQTREIHGTILDKNNQSALPYANIYLLRTGRGSISNENGHFTLDITDLQEVDTIRFQYIGYKTRLLTIGDLEEDTQVFMEEEIFNLNELIVFGGKIPDLKTIVKNVLIYKDSNYRRTTSRRQTFIRDREMADLTNFKLNYKKSSIDELDRETIQLMEDRTPDYVTSYTDFLGYYYYNTNKDDSVRRKLDPIRMVALKEEYLDDLKEFETLFEGIFAQTEEDEYWKVKSGVFGTKLDLEEEQDDADTLNENRRKSSSHARYIGYLLGYSLFNDKDQWEFLHKTGKYKYTLVGGTSVNGEDAYIIDFEPGGSGIYEGRLFVTMQNYALIRADYNYAPGKNGRDIQLLGVGYTESQFDGSIFFEKKDDNYVLKYFSHRAGYEASIDRSLVLMKKKKRWLFDKRLKEIKLGIDMVVKVQESVEFLVIDEEEISNVRFHEYGQPEYFDVITVDQFDDNLWRGYSIIEPIQQMKEYKKQNVSKSKN